jgi:hypothetical protein
MIQASSFMPAEAELEIDAVQELEEGLPRLIFPAIHPYPQLNRVVVVAMGAGFA